MFRDPWYVVPLGMLVGVIIISAAMGAGPSAVDSAVPSVPGIPRQIEPTPTPDYTNDYTRTADLFALKDAALNYYRRNGFFPTTNNAIVALCSGNADAGCVLRQSVRGIPVGDGESPYYYMSDGSSYVIFVARSDAQGDLTQCPSALPPDLANTPVICSYAEAPD